MTQIGPGIRDPGREDPCLTSGDWDRDNSGTPGLGRGGTLFTEARAISPKCVTEAQGTCSWDKQP